MVFVWVSASPEEMAPAVRKASTHLTLSVALMYLLCLVRQHRTPLPLAVFACCPTGWTHPGLVPGSGFRASRLAASTCGPTSLGRGCSGPGHSEGKLLSLRPGGPSTSVRVALRAHPREEGKTLDHKIMKQYSAEGVLELLVDAYHTPSFIDPKFDRVNVVTSFAKFAQLGDKMTLNLTESKKFQCLLNYTQSEITHMSASHLGDLALSVTRLHIRGEADWHAELMLLIWGALPVKLDQASPGDLIKFALCMASWQLNDASSRTGILRSALRFMGDFTTKELILLVWSFAAVGKTDLRCMDLCEQVAEALLRRWRLAACDLDDLGRLAWAFERLSGFLPLPGVEPLLSKICDALPEAHIASASKSDEAFAYAAIMLASARQGLLSPSVVDLVASRKTLLNIHEASAYSVAAMIRALETSSLTQGQFFNALTVEAQSRGITDRDLESKAVFSTQVWTAALEEAQGP
ncbi:unnamed protein product [Polarella glacialis]|uniref:Uncharacterized protein n=1 Tax=Polarella glacialis TaxID=89957 RepID=A0A813DCH8_POLGL|nr:unnamed protein product [Polarella glacialis]